ncbi:unnamed protein product [Fraxinus pennsylvanica]|uniref:POX domain-containing protein n=1 Tax=Fraxinus pennsylvanica TaxID=56036 RepID=A0AAD2A301_9LAMI|nr:unnamed protein product [Fraxinus pennsylvanica]
MQAMVISFELVIGNGAAMPYTELAQKAMSQHFRGTKDAIIAQVKQTCEILGENDVTISTGLTKGETPKLKLLEQKFRQQKSLHHMGMLDPEAWRPQRGLAEPVIVGQVEGEYGRQTLEECGGCAEGVTESKLCVLLLVVH